MNARRPSARRTRAGGGFTLIEVVIAVVLSGLIIGVIAAGLITSLNVSRSTTDQVGDSNDAGLISSYLIRDAQSSGGIDPITAERDPTLGVFAPSTEWGGCQQPGALVVRFGWKDRPTTSDLTTVVVTYAFRTFVDDPVSGTQHGELNRRICMSSKNSATGAVLVTAPIDIVLGNRLSIAPIPEARCQVGTATVSCNNNPTSVSLTVAGLGTRAPLAYTLKAAIRPVASQLTIVSPASPLRSAQLQANYASPAMATIGASGQTTWYGPPDLEATTGLKIDQWSGMVWGKPRVSGPLDVKVTVKDALNATASRLYKLNILAPPVAVADSYPFTEDAPPTTVAAADGVLKNDPVGSTAILTSTVTHGTLAFYSDGHFTYTPEPNWNGPDTFWYKARITTSDGLILDSAAVQVTLSVSAVNDGPLNKVPGPQTTLKNVAKVFSNASDRISISDVDAAGGNVQVKLIATKGTVTLPGATGLGTPSVSGTDPMTLTITGTVANINLSLVGATFTPKTDFTGAAMLQLITNDQGNTGAGGAKTTPTDSVTINVTNPSLGIFTGHTDIGDLPRASGTNSSYSSSTYTVKGSGWDIWGANDGFQFLYRPLTGDGRLTARIVSEDVTYNPPQNPTLQCRADVGWQPCISVSKAEVMFRAQDLTGVSAMHASVGMTQGNGSEFIYRRSTGAGALAASAGDSPDFPAWVRLTRRGNQFTAEIFDGTTWVQWGDPQTITMGSTIYVGLASSAVYQLDTPTNQTTKLNSTVFDNVSISTPPIGSNDTYSVDSGTTLTVPATTGLLANDTDPESDILTAVGPSDPPHGSLQNFSASGSFEYTPDAGYVGADSFTYSAFDGVFNSGLVTVNITVNPGIPPNIAPSFTKGPDQIIQTNLGAQTVAGWATNLDPGAGEASQSVDFIVTNNNPLLFSVPPSISPDGTLSYAPAAFEINGSLAIGTASVSVRIHDNGGTANGGVDTSALQTFTITIAPDTTGPTGGSVDAIGLVGTGGRYTPSATPSLTLATGTDPSRVAATGAQLKRATATLTSVGGTADGVCGAFGPYALVTGGTDPVSPWPDTVADQACYRYQYVVADTVGNSTTYTSSDLKADLTAPTPPTLSFSALPVNNTYWSAANPTVVYYRSTATPPTSFTTTAAATDAGSGIASYAFPAPTGWTSTPGALGVNTYTWGAAAGAAAATPSVTATNNATGTSAGASFNLTADNTAPAVGTLTYADGSTTSTSVSVTFPPATDTGGSGVATRLLQRQSATGGGCTGWTGWTTLAGANGTNPTSPVTDAVSPGTCYKYQYKVTDYVGNEAIASSTNVVVRKTYFNTIYDDAGLLSYWRLGEATTSLDTFTGAASATLQSRSGDVGATWAKLPAASTTNAVITVATTGRIRKNGTTTAGVLYYSSAVPGGADYTVEAEVYVASSVSGDRIGVVGRLDSTLTTETAYEAVYDRAAQMWKLYRVVTNTRTQIGTTTLQALTNAVTYRLALDMNGSTIRLLVDGVQKLSVTDSAITATGRGGILLGVGGTSTTITNAAGMHLDNFRVTPALTDSHGTNAGDYLNGPTLARPGAISNDSNTAAQFDGTNDFGTVARQISDDFSIELWFKSAQVFGATCTSWLQGAGLVDASVAGTNNDFGVALCAGKVVAGVGNPDISVVSVAGLNNGAWHHVVLTRTKVGGVVRLYIDGVQAGTVTGNTNSLNAAANINFGRLQSGSNYFAGSLDEIAVYSTVLDAATVSAHYNAGF